MEGRGSRLALYDWLDVLQPNTPPTAARWDSLLDMMFICSDLLDNLYTLPANITWLESISW